MGILRATFRITQTRNRTAEDFKDMPVTSQKRATSSKSRKTPPQKAPVISLLTVTIRHLPLPCEDIRLEAWERLDALRTFPNCGLDHDHRLGCDADSSPCIVASLRWDIRWVRLKHRVAGVAPIDFRAECQGILRSIGGRVRPMWAGCDGQCGANTGCASIVYPQRRPPAFFPWRKVKSAIPRGRQESLAACRSPLRCDPKDHPMPQAPWGPRWVRSDRLGS